MNEEEEREELERLKRRSEELIKDLSTYITVNGESYFSIEYIKERILGIDKDLDIIEKKLDEDKEDDNK